MGKVVYANFEKNSAKTKFENAKAKLKNSKKMIHDFILQNPELSATIATIAISAGSGIIKFAAKKSVQHKAQQLKEHYCYDRSLGHYWKLKRELSNNEWREVERRKNNGEQLGNILDQMKVLK